MVRYTIHKHHYPERYFPEIGADPMPEILMLERLYAPEIAPAMHDLITLYHSSVESMLLPEISAYDPIDAKIKEIQAAVRTKIEALC